MELAAELYHSATMLEPYKRRKGEWESGSYQVTQACGHEGQLGGMRK